MQMFVLTISPSIRKPFNILLFICFVNRRTVKQRQIVNKLKYHNWVAFLVNRMFISCHLFLKSHAINVAVSQSMLKWECKIIINMQKNITLCRSSNILADTLLGYILPLRISRGLFANKYPRQHIA